MKKILVIATGGTIGSDLCSGSVDISQNKNHIQSNLIERYCTAYGGENTFEVVSPFCVLSENIGMREWQKLIDCIYAVNPNEYSGIIITHGSDTLAYTSAFIGIAFSDFPIPIVLTASNLPLANPESNGLDNFHTAVCVINAELLHGVFSVYKGADGVNSIHLAERISPADPYTDEFKSFGENIFAKAVGNDVVFNLNPQNPNIMQLKKLPERVPKLALKQNVIMLTPYPGIDYSRISVDENVCAVLHTLYHSSTAPTENSGLAEFINRCIQSSIDFYILPFKPSDNFYISSRKLIDAKAIALNGISECAAYAKLCAAYAQSEISPRDFMQRQINFEYINRGSAAKLK